MPAGLILYNIITGFLFLIGFPFLILYNLAQGKYSSHLVERLGRYPLPLRPEKPYSGKGPIWVHAVSVGEIKAAVTLTRKIKAQLPDIPVLVSTTTPAGRETAERLLGKEIPLIYFPLDFFPCVKRAMNHIRPRAFVALETELWPNFIYLAERSGSSLILANGRISQRSFSRYKKIRWLLRPLLKRFDLLLVRDTEDAQRLVSLGADSRTVKVFGNIKYDGLLSQAGEALFSSLRQRLDIAVGRPVLVAGSTRSGEEAVLIEVYRQVKVHCPDLLLILAPRHIDRCPEIENLLQDQRLPFQLYGRVLSQREPWRTEILLVDRIGDLFALYSLATLAFCGASLVPKGGQNILEPAAWGKVVFYGPYMEDFKDARRLLEKAGAGFTVRDSGELERQVIYFLDHPEERERRGVAGREALKSQTGLTKKAAEIIAEVIRSKV
ncbi:MAG: 3-deoxy-D-manno-octulosonic acid transferase [Thermodesulfobacteriota bacterium]